MRLTEARIRALVCPPGTRDKLYFDDDQRGLGVRVTSAGSRSFLAQYSFGGTKRRVPLGSCDAISLSAARDAAAAIMGDRAKGGDPAGQRKAEQEKAKVEAERNRLTLAALIESWEALHLSNRRPGYRHEATRALRNGFAAQLDRPAEAIDRAMAVRILDGIAARPALSVASRTGAYAHAMFRWAVRRGVLEVNPFRDLPPIGTRPKRDRVLTDDELAAIWRALDDTLAPFGEIVRLLLLTGQRRTEVAEMRWREISDDLETWTLAGERAKTGTPNVVPLSRPARDVLAGLDRREGNDDLVFGDRVFTTWGGAKELLDKKCGVADWRLHDLRRTLATGLQRLGVRLEVTESVLNHIAGSRAGIVGVYQRHTWATEKEAALDAWAAHVTALVEQKPKPSNVRRLRR